MKLVYKPFGIVFGIVAGLVAKRLFDSGLGPDRQGGLRPARRRETAPLGKVIAAPRRSRA